MRGVSRDPARSDSRRVFVRVESGFYAGLEWPLEGGNSVIGRGRNADLVLSEATISRAHAVFGFSGDRLFVQDLDSTNGTLVNNRREKQTFLSVGDELQMGRLMLRIGAMSDRKNGEGRNARR